MSDEQLAISAQMATQGKGGNLSDKQMQFANDILSSYRLLLQMADLEKQYAGAPPAAGPAAGPKN